MTVIDDEGVKVDGTWYPFAPFEDCPGCRFLKHLGEVEGMRVDRDVCTMSPEDEDAFLFNDVPDDKLPACMRS